MFSPDKSDRGDINQSQSQSEDINQSGGAYIDPSISKANLALVSSISQSTLSTLLILANKSSMNLSSFSQVAQLNILQISSLIAAVGTQIASEQRIISDNQSQIQTLNNQIGAIGITGSLTDNYNLTQQQYNSVLTAYSNASTALANDNIQLSTYMNQLSTQYGLSSFYNMSIMTLARQYSSLYNSTFYNSSTIDGLNAIYNAQMSTYMINANNYSTSQGQYASTLYALNYNSTILSTAMYDYYSTSTAYGNLYNDYVNYSVITLSTAQGQYLSSSTFLGYLNALSTQQLMQYVSSSTALAIANTQVRAAQAIVDYDNAVIRQVSTLSLIEYKTIQINQFTSTVASAQPVPVDPMYVMYGLPVPAIPTYIVGTNLTTLNGQLTDYYNLSIAYNQSTIYANALKTTVSSTAAEALTMQMNIADYNISTAQYNLYIAQLIQYNDISTYNALSSQLAYYSTIQQNEISTLKGLSSIELQEISTLGWLNDQITAYQRQYSSINYYLMSTVYNISYLNQQSSIYNYSVAKYYSSYLFYQNLESIAQNAVNDYTNRIAINNSTIAGLQTQAGTTGQTLGQQYVTLRNQSDSFYSNQLLALGNDLDQYMYTVQEWNSFIGYLTSELLIYKLNLYTQIDAITFDLQNPVGQQQPNDIVNRNNLVDLQTKIQGVIDALNPLDTQFNTLLQYVGTERTKKTDFIATRKALTLNEITYLQTPSTTTLNSLQTSYLSQLQTLQGLVVDINSNIYNRNTTAQTLMNTTITPQLQNLNALKTPSGNQILSYTTPPTINLNLQAFNLLKQDYIILSSIQSTMVGLYVLAGVATASNYSFVMP